MYLLFFNIKYNTMPIRKNIVIGQNTAMKKGTALLSILLYNTAQNVPTAVYNNKLTTIIKNMNILKHLQ